MNEQNLDKIYQKHHGERRRAGFAILEKERGELFARLIGKNKKVLDLGCRDGVITKYFSANNIVVGVDIDSKILEIAGKNLGIKTMNFDVQQEWPITNEEKYDVVVAGEILEHIYFPEELIRKAKGVLNPGGIFIGSIPNAFSLINRIRYFLGQKSGTPLADPMHINHFSYGEISELLGRHFSHVELYPLGRTYGGLVKVFPSLLSYSLGFKAN